MHDFLWKSAIFQESAIVQKCSYQGAEKWNKKYTYLTNEHNQNVAVYTDNR